MKRWKLRYELYHSFSAPIISHTYSLRCFPMERSLQRVQQCQYEVSPCSGNSLDRDSFGNALLTGRCDDAHDWFYVTTNATVLREQGEEPEQRAYHQLGMYRYETALTRVGSCLQKFYETLPADGGRDDWERTAQWMRHLAEVFVYQSGSTQFETSAEDAFVQGYGVCQDYAHILLALCRKDKMTARYVAGAIPGEGESHAWIEVWSQGRWKGFDPTHQRETNEDYVCFSVGRDAEDCPLNQGIFRGGSGQEQKINVKMEEM